MGTPSTKTEQNIYFDRRESLRMAAAIGKNTNKLRNASFLFNFFVFTSEFACYLLVFLILFQWRVVPSIKLSDPQTWLTNQLLMKEYAFLLAIIFFIYCTYLAKKGLFQLHSQLSFFDEISYLVRAIFYSFLIAIGILFILKTSVIYSRAVVLTYSVGMLLIAIIFRAIRRLFILFLKRKGLLTQRVVIIGAGEVGEKIKQFLTRQKSTGYHVVGYVDDFKKGKDILGKIHQLEEIIIKEKINELYITIPSERETMLEVISKLRKYDLNIKIIPELFDFVSSAIRFKQMEGYPYIEVVKTPLRGFNVFLKRTIDIVLSSIGLIILSPLLLITAICIKLDSKGPIFFKQQRIGKNGIPFTMYKFRSMVVNAEELKQQLIEQNEADGPVFKIKDDPRITRVGKFIRKYSIDELPQLINVLKGEMSLIGPRPPLSEEVIEYTDYHWRRLDVLPGISGLWQVSGRSDLSFEEWVNLDIYYIENWSLLLDIKILFRTIPVVLFGKGAY